jgi:hypothetical protein
MMKRSGCLSGFSQSGSVQGSAQMSTSKSKTIVTQQSTPNGANGANVRPEFVKYRLTEKELAQARAACASPLDLGAIIGNFVDEGYKISIGHDNYGGGFQAFATSAVKDGPNFGWTLTARAPDVEQALGMLAYKHFTLFNRQWPKEVAVNKGETWG